MTARPGRLAAALLLSALAGPARGHHGSASVSFIGAEGPGAAIDTTTPLPLGQGTAFALVKTEYVPWQQREGLVDQKQYFWFDTLAVGAGILPWLSAYAFQPYAVKAQDGAGTNTGLGDPSLLVAGAFKWDDGLRLAPEKESLDDLRDWHFGAWTGASIPLGPTAHRDAHGIPFEPDVQTGFGAPSFSAGLTVLKQVSADFTVLGEVNAQWFLAHDYAEAGYRYQFGTETRVNGAVPWRAYAAGRTRVDLVPELGYLNLQRDRQDGVPLRASGGSILYGQLGVRAAFGPLSVGAAVKRPLAARLNEASEQQGAEGLEVLRAALVVGYATRL